MPDAVADAASTAPWWVPADRRLDWLDRELEEAEADGIVIHRDGALVVARPAPFEAGVFGRRMGKVIAAGAQGAPAGLLPALLREAAQHLDLQHVSWRIPCGRADLCEAAVRGGFLPVDVQLSFSHGLTEVPAATRAPQVRAAEPRDEEPLAALAARSFRTSRFFRDPRLPARQAEALFREWTRNDLRGRAEQTWVATAGQELLGFISCTPHQRGPDRPRAGAWIDLIAVHENARGMGVGRRLVAHALTHYASRTTYVGVQTQADNAGAVRLYQGCGFRFESASITFHAAPPVRPA